MYVSDAEALLEKVTPETPIEQMRYDLVPSFSTTCVDSTPRSRSRIGEFAGREGLGHLGD